MEDSVSAYEEWRAKKSREQRTIITAIFIAASMGVGIIGGLEIDKNNRAAQHEIQAQPKTFQAP
jgi:hypothetical protein